MFTLNRLFAQLRRARDRGDHAAELILMARIARELGIRPWVLTRIVEA